MRLNPRALLGRASPWTCPDCARSPITSQARRAFSDARAVRTSRPRKRVNRVYLAAAGGTLGAGGLLFFGDEIKHGYLAVERTGRVLTALAVCINDYRTTLKQEGDEAEQSSLLKACHSRCADRTLKVLEKNGSIFVKLGQHLSSMGYLLPLEWTQPMVVLQDKCPVSSYESIEEMYLKDTGHRIEEDFDEFSKEPIGAASLAQVHTGVLRGSDQKVAIKAQHPHLDEFASLDLALTRFTFKALKKAFPEYDMEWLSDEMAVSLPKELDFALEGKNAMMARDYFHKNTKFPLIIPEVFSSRRRILVMDFVQGARIDNLDYIDSHSISRDEVSATMARVFNTMIFSSGAPLHCDPHGGNIAVRHNPNRRYPYNFDLILYDHGLYRMPEDKMRRDYAKMWLAVIDSDESQMRKYAHEIAGITDEQFPLFASAITGRDYRVLTNKAVSISTRDAEESENIRDAFGDGLLQQLVELLGKVPRIILLILKTNDLTRSLDEGLETQQGPMRNFMILAKYASRTVWEEQKEIIRAQGSLLWPSNLLHLMIAFSSFARVELKLWSYERYLSVRRHLGMDRIDYAKSS